MLFSPCASSIFNGKPVHECLEDIRNAGYDMYEFWSWWDQDIGKIAKKQSELEMKPAAICTRFIPLNDSNRRNEYIKGLKESIEVAQFLKCKMIISQVGQTIDDLSYSRQKKSIIDGLKACVPMIEAHDITLVFEPLNTKIDHHGYFLEFAHEAFDIASKIGNEHVKVLYDIYHQYISERSPLVDILENINHIGHFHLAGYPGRHEPWIDSEIDYKAILCLIRNAGYAGGIGLEYFPVEENVEGLQKFSKTIHRSN